MIEISTDTSKLQLEVIHSFLKESYWAKDRTFEEVTQTIENSICFGMYKNNKQIGFARVVSDTLVFAYIMDVFILEEYQGNGYGKQLLKSIFENEKLKSCKSWYLKTEDAHKVYEKFGFVGLSSTERWMEFKR